MAKIIQSGNSIAVTIPAKFVKKTGVRVGDEVVVKTYPEKGKMTINFTNLRQLPLIQ